MGSVTVDSSKVIGVQAENFALGPGKIKTDHETCQKYALAQK